MRYLLSEHPQGTDEWKRDRAGKATGSRACDIVAKIKTGEAAARRNYRTQLIVERLTGEPSEDRFVSKEMLWGLEQEPYARMAFEAATGLIVQEAGFAYLPKMMAGCSVDGLIEDSKFGKLGIFECKCPLSATHIGYLQDSCVPSEYMPQILHNLYITGADFADFASYDPRFPERLRLFWHRYWRDEEAITKYESELVKFLEQVDAQLFTLTKFTDIAYGNENSVATQI